MYLTEEERRARMDWMRRTGKPARGVFWTPTFGDLWDKACPTLDRHSLSRFGEGNRNVLTASPGVSLPS